MQMSHRRPLPGPPREVRGQEHGHQQRGPASSRPALARWNDPGQPRRGPRRGPLPQSFVWLRKWLPVFNQGDNKHLQAGVEDGGGDREAEARRRRRRRRRQHQGLPGDGLLQHRLPLRQEALGARQHPPRTQREFPGGVGLRRMLAERIETRGGRAMGVVARLSDRRKLRFAANTVVVAGGVLASSLLLDEAVSAADGSARPLVQRRCTADRRLRAGAQLLRRASDHPPYRPPGEDQLIFESWFNPVGAQALMMPGWFSDHYEKHARYPHLSCIGVVVGSQSNGRVKTGFRGRGMKLARSSPSREVDPEADDQERKLAGRIHFASGAGAGDADDLPLALLPPPSTWTSSTRSSRPTSTSGFTSPTGR